MIFNFLIFPFIFAMQFLACDISGIYLMKTFAFRLIYECGILIRSYMTDVLITLLIMVNVRLNMRLYGRFF